MPARRKCGPKRWSRPMPRATWTTSAPVASHTFAISLMKLIRVMRNAFEASFTISAEMVKLASNAFLMTRISFINEIANVCEATGADVVQVARGIGLDHRLGPHFLRAGIGYGGSCFPKDSLALKQRRMIGKLKKHLGSLRGTTVALLGLAFKPNTDDVREAPSIVLASRLHAEGAEVRAWDPVARPSELVGNVTFCDTPLEAVTGADAAAIVTGWAQVRQHPGAET